MAHSKQEISELLLMLILIASAICTHERFQPIHVFQDRVPMGLAITIKCKDQS